MERSTKRRLRACMVLLLALAQAPSLLAADDPGPLTHGEVLIGTGIAAGFQLASVLESFAYGESYYPCLMLGTVTLQQVPGLAYDTKDAVGLGVAQVSLDALWACNYGLGLSGYLNPLLFNAAHKLSMYGTYDAYMDMRGRCSDEAYAAAVHDYGFLELAAAPFSPRFLGKWYVWGTLASIAAIKTVGAITADQSSAVWTTGRSFLSDTELPVWAGVSLALLAETVNYVMTGIGEESLYRGTYYEEMKYDVGPLAARLIDAAYFTLSHYPQQTDTLLTEDASTILLDFAYSFGYTLWLQCVYDWGGLPASVAVHAWGDVISFMCQWLLTGGAAYADDSGFTLNASKSGSFSLGYRLAL